MQIQPYLFFDGRCQEAIDFYRQALGAEVVAIMRFKENPDIPTDAMPPEMADKVMHAALKIGQSTVLASDGQCTGQQPKPQGFSLALSPATDAEAERLFAVLAEGGEIQMPMAETFFASRFGALVDRFGISWMIHVDTRAPATA